MPDTCRNKALLDNAARPSGALVYGARDGERLTDSQFEALKDQLSGVYSGAANAGRPILLEGGMDWKPLSLTPAEMDFVGGKHAAAREIALAFGVPPQLSFRCSTGAHPSCARAIRTERPSTQ